MTAKYAQPYDQPDNPDASYQDGNAELGILGSIPRARALEWPQRELISALTANGITPDGSDNTQLAAAIKSRAKAQVGRGISLVLGANQSIPNNVETAVTWPTPLVDTDGVWNGATPSRIKIPAGQKKLRVAYQACFDASATGSRKVRILLDGIYEGSGLPAGRVPSASGTDITIIQGSGGIIDIVALSLGLVADGSNYLQMMVLQDSGAALNQRLNNTWFTVEWLD